MTCITVIRPKERVFFLAKLVANMIIPVERAGQEATKGDRVKHHQRKLPKHSAAEDENSTPSRAIGGHVYEPTGRKLNRVASVDFAQLPDSRPTSEAAARGHKRGRVDHKTPDSSGSRGDDGWSTTKRSQPIQTDEGMDIRANLLGTTSPTLMGVHRVESGSNVNQCNRSIMEGTILKMHDGVDDGNPKRHIVVRSGSAYI